MRRRALRGVAVLAIGTAGAFLLEGAAMVLVWEAVMVAAIYLVAREAWPDRSRKTPPLFGGGGELWSLPPRVLASLELEIAAAVDPHLSGERPLRSRLLTLLSHRAGTADGSIRPDRGRRLLGDRAWRILAEEEGSMELEEIEELTDRIEAI